MDAEYKFQFNELYNRKIEVLLEQLLKFKFEGIRIVDISHDADDMIVISFEDNGMYSQEEVHKYIEELKNDFAWNK